MHFCWQSSVSAFHKLSRFVITFLPKSRRLLISWLHSSSAVNLEPPKIKSVSISVVSLSICYEVMGLVDMIFLFWMLNFNLAFSLMNSMKRQKDMTLKDEPPRSVGAHFATGDQWRSNSRKNEETELSKNNTQLWMWLVMEVKCNAVKSNIA